MRESETPSPSQRPGGLGLALRLLLVLGFVLYGVFVGLQTGKRLKEAQVAKLGLADNHGRLATLLLRDPLTGRTERYRVLLAKEGREAEAYQYAKRAEEVQGVFLYYRSLVLYPFQVERPFRAVLFLSPSRGGDGGEGLPRSPCRFVPKAPYRASLELKAEPEVGFGGLLELEDYGRWVLR